MHPEALADRQARARNDRRVCLEPAEDGMAWLSLYLEAERGVAILAHLDLLAGPGGAEAVAAGADAAGAGASVAAGPDRTRRQLTLDLAADLLLGRSRESGAASPLGVVVPKVYVTVPVLTLLGHSEEPAELDGYGPIDADAARRLAAHAPSFRRILTHPETGAYLSYGRKSYRVPADLAGYLRVRDGGCRFPGCSRRAAGCDVDHTVDWAAGGVTRHDNIAHLCRKHHRLKHKTGWRMSQLPNGDIRWTSPAGREYVSTPANPFMNARGSDLAGTRAAYGASATPSSGAPATREPRSARPLTAAPMTGAPSAPEPAATERADATGPELPDDPPWAARQILRDDAEAA
jgi:hypothetical protein